jgi:hypothetical protein
MQLRTSDLQLCKRIHINYRNATLLMARRRERLETKGTQKIEYLQSNNATEAKKLTVINCRLGRLSKLL